MSVSLKIIGVQQTIQFLNRKRKRVDNKLIPLGLKRAAIFLQGEVKQSIAGRKAEPTSVDTGRFLNSVGITFTKVDAKIFSDVPYAKKLEFGFGGFKARKHFRNSKDRNKQNIRRILSTAIKSI